MEKMRHKSMVEKTHEKSLQFLKKKISEKKILQAYLCRYDPQKAVQNLFLSKWSGDT